jgi:hypothetical protein
MNKQNKKTLNSVLKEIKLDKRYNTTKVLNRWCNKYTAASALWGFLIGSLLSMYFSLEAKNRTPEALERKVIPQVVEVKAIEKDWDLDPVGYIRFRGNEIGYDEYDITKLHGLLDCENGLHTPDRVNYLYDGENGRYTAAGIAMITNSTWRQHKCTGSKWDATDNIDCFYKIIGDNKLSDYKASKSCWIEKFNPNDIFFIKVE